MALFQREPREAEAVGEMEEVGAAAAEEAAVEAAVEAEAEAVEAKAAAVEEVRRRPHIRLRAATPAMRRTKEGLR